MLWALIKRTLTPTWRIVTRNSCRFASPTRSRSIFGLLTQEKTIKASEINNCELADPSSRTTITISCNFFIRIFSASAIFSRAVARDQSVFPWVEPDSTNWKTDGCLLLNKKKLSRFTRSCFVWEIMIIWLLLVLKVLLSIHTIVNSKLKFC